MSAERGTLTHPALYEAQFNVSERLPAGLTKTEHCEIEWSTERKAWRAHGEGVEGYGPDPSRAALVFLTKCLSPSKREVMGPPSSKESRFEMLLFVVCVVCAVTTFTFAAYGAFSLLL